MYHGEFERGQRGSACRGRAERSMNTAQDAGRSARVQGYRGQDLSGPGRGGC